MYATQPSSFLASCRGRGIYGASSKSFTIQSTRVPKTLCCAQTHRTLSASTRRRAAPSTTAFVTDDPDLTAPDTFRGVGVGQKAGPQLITHMNGFSLSEGRVLFPDEVSKASAGGGGNNGKGKGPGGGGGGDGNDGEGSSRSPLSWWVYLPFVLTVYGGILGLFLFVLVRTVARAIASFTIRTTAQWDALNSSPTVCKLKDLAAPAVESAQRNLSLCEIRITAWMSTCGLQLPMTMHQMSKNWQWTMISMAGFASVVKALAPQ